MKNFVIKSLIFALPILLATTLSASITNTLKIETDANEKSIYLSFQANESNAVMIQLKDANEAILHQEFVSNKIAFAKKFNLENLPKGVYFLQISDDLKEIVQPINISVSDLAIDPLTRIENFKPVYKYSNNKLDINLLAINNEKINIEIFNAENQAIFAKSFKNDGKPFGERLDLSKLQAGVYSVKINAGNNTFYKSVEVK